MSVCHAGLLMVLTAAFEFNPQYSKLLPPRPSDDEELNEVHVGR